MRRLVFFFRPLLSLGWHLLSLSLSRAPLAFPLSSPHWTAPAGGMRHCLFLDLSQRAQCGTIHHVPRRPRLCPAKLARPAYGVPCTIHA